MTAECVLTNARIVAPDGVFSGTVAVAGGLIAGLDTAASGLPSAIDLEGDFLIPGLVELHTDYLEQHYAPRPDVFWPSGLAAVIAYDTGIAGAGITTVFDSLTVGDYTTGGKRKLMFADAMASIHQAVDSGLLRAEHHLHLRCEVADPAMAEMLTQYADEPMLRLASVMDHTPGQRQWSDIESFRTFYRDKKWTDEEMFAEIERRQALHHRHAAENYRLALDLCRKRGIAVASHDDTTPEHVDEAVANGLTISEFPTTAAAARRAREQGMAIVMGAPNAVRGGSHAGNVSTVELAAEGLVDAMSSDYAPKSLLHAAWLLHDRLGLGLPQAVATVSTNPAHMVGMDDRGAIAPGKRADLIQVRLVGDLPVVRHVWRQGSLVL